MSLAVARIASQVVSGVEVARAWSAALARNGGERARIARRASAYAGPQSMGSGQVAGGVKRSGQRYQEENYQRDEYGQRYRNGDGHSAAQQVRQRERMTCGCRLLAENGRAGGTVARFPRAGRRVPDACRRLTRDANPVFDPPSPGQPGC